MSIELSNDDRCVVDVLLDQEAGSAGIALCYSTASPATLQERMNRVDRVLHLLDHFRAGDPAPDLVARTLGRCAGEESAAIERNPAHEVNMARSSA